MRNTALTWFALLMGLNWEGRAAEQAWIDPSPHKSKFVEVDSSVKLEILDWGGSGRDVILLAELGHTAHAFDDFATRLAKTSHVIGITRRGYFPSDAPVEGYDPDRLAEDIAQVIDRLNLKHPVVIGHSIASVEMNAFVSKYPARAAGLVFLDGPYDRTDASMRSMRSLEHKIAPMPPSDADLADRASVSRYFERIRGTKLPEAEERMSYVLDSNGKFLRFRSNASPASAKILGSIRALRYADIHIPALAVFRKLRSAQDFDGYRKADHVAYQEVFEAWEPVWRAEVSRFRNEVAQGQVVELPGANHHVYASHEDRVLSEVTSFINSLRD